MSVNLKLADLATYLGNDLGSERFPNDQNGIYRQSSISLFCTRSKVL